MHKNNPLPILYSLRNCPFAMRARLAIYQSQVPVLLRDIVLRDKPAEMLTASPKGTVPVLVTSNGTVIEESIEVMLWALSENDPNDLLMSNDDNILDEMRQLIFQFDDKFKPCLEAYRAAKRYHEPNLVECRQSCEHYLSELENRLTQHSFLMAAQESLADLALLPFIRQFAKVERQWYLQSPYPKLRQWLDRYLQSKMFSKVMSKHELWLVNRIDVLMESKSS
ncbi:MULTISPECIES: glutathione S-transferase [Vibrio]|uniref:Glutathione S-transferase n=2 Tax=Vibrio casei TaxID=673372 RepID=A0A368LMF2_9VIBR|nr:MULTISPECIES: glutathione S-transferase [Vibrio]RCS73074.1 glutathione S-transferase [Vibrio casei]HBV75570.1 glutathione S-transferase [Vibrio sp.]